ncbi:MAG: hypothetical protein WDO24_20100 [Pseudomonadota bacterium]
MNGVPAHQLLATPLVLAAATLVLRRAPRIAFSSFRCAQVDRENLTLPYHQDSRIIALLAPGLVRSRLWSISGCRCRTAATTAPGSRS